MFVHHVMYSIPADRDNIAQLPCDLDGFLQVVVLQPMQWW